MKFLKSLLAAAVTTVLVSAPVVSNAAVALKLEELAADGVTVLASVTITDGGAGDVNSAAGLITYVGSVGTAWTMNITSGFGDTYTSGFLLDLTSQSNSNGGGILRLSFSETNLYAGAFGPTPTLFGGTLSGNTTGTTSTSSFGLYADDSALDSALFSKSQTVFTGTTAPVPPNAFVGSANGYATVTDPFSLTLEVTLKHAGAGFTSLDYSVTVPEPTSIALIGAALLGIGAAARRRKA